MSTSLSSNQSFSPLIIRNGEYIAKLIEIEKILPSFLSNESNWETLDINYHPPRVERLWMQYKEYRVYLHRIHPAKSNEVLFLILILGLQLCA